MKNFIFAVVGALALIIGSVAVSHYTSDASVVQADPNC